LEEKSQYFISVYIRWLFWKCKLINKIGKYLGNYFLLVPGPWATAIILGQYMYWKICNLQGCSLRLARLILLPFLKLPTMAPCVPIQFSWLAFAGLLYYCSTLTSFKQVDEYLLADILPYRIYYLVCLEHKLN
jgi:hypothetical protein